MHGQLCAVLEAEDVSGLVFIVEQPAASRPLPVGDATTVHGLPAVFAERGDGEMLAWVEHGTLVEVSANNSRAAASRIAERAQATPLVPFEQTQAGSQLLNPRQPSPPAWTDIPLSARLGTPVAARATANEIQKQCRWQPSASAFRSSSPRHPPSSPISAMRDREIRRLTCLEAAVTFRVGKCLVAP